MAKASINFQKATAHSFDHNFRKDKPNYLLPEEFQKSNEFWKHEKSEKQIFDEELSKAKRKGGRIPKLENSRWEAVLNLNANHTLEDVKKVAEHIEKKFNITCTGISIHRDEGYIDENGKPNYNYHAHINFMTYKDGRQNWRKEHIKPSNLSELQTEIANMLNMDRGKLNSKAKRLDHSQYKAVAKEKEQQLVKQKDLKAEIAQLREQLKQQGAVREDYARLEALNRDLKQLIKAKELTNEQLEKEIARYKQQNQTQSNEIEKHKEIIEELKKSLKNANKRIKSLERENAELRAEVSELKRQLKQRSTMKERQQTRKELNAKQRELKEKEFINQVDKFVNDNIEIFKARNDLAFLAYLCKNGEYKGEDVYEILYTFKDILDDLDEKQIIKCNLESIRVLDREELFEEMKRMVETTGIGTKAKVGRQSRRR